MAKKILIIDDDESILDALKICLEEHEYQVLAILDAGEIKSSLDNSFPDLIILDLLMSGTDGRQIARRLKKDKKTQKIPILMISAHPFAKHAAKEAGVDDFISKPFDLDEILVKIRKFI